MLSISKSLLSRGYNTIDISTGSAPNPANPLQASAAAALKAMPRLEI